MIFKSILLILIYSIHTLSLASKRENYASEAFTKILNSKRYPISKKYYYHLKKSNLFNREKSFIGDKKHIFFSRNSKLVNKECRTIIDTELETPVNQMLQYSIYKACVFRKDISTKTLRTLLHKHYEVFFKHKRLFSHLLHRLGVKRKIRYKIINLSSDYLGTEFKNFLYLGNELKVYDSWLKKIKKMAVHNFEIYNGLRTDLRKNKTLEIKDHKLFKLDYYFIESKLRKQISRDNNKNKIDNIISISKLLLKNNNFQRKSQPLFNLVYFTLAEKNYDNAKIIEAYDLSENNLSKLNEKALFWLYIYYKNKSIRKSDDLLAYFSKFSPLSFYNILINQKIDLDLSEKSEPAPELTSSNKLILKKINLIKKYSPRYLKYYQEELYENIAPYLKENKYGKLDIIINHFSTNNDYLQAFSFINLVFENGHYYFSKNIIETLFPNLHMSDLKDNNYGIDPYFYLSIIRQESAFNHRAVSRAKAVGLMQILVRTARSVKRRVTFKKLLNPKTNIYIGKKYFYRLLKKNAGNPIWSLASYNAGIGNVNRWKRRFGDAIDGLYLIERIPFKETNKYVKLIIRNYIIYKKIYSGEEIKLGHLLEDFKTTL